MDKIFMDAKDKNVAKVVIYVGEQPDNGFFYDEAMTQEVPVEDMLDLFLKGVVVHSGPAYISPIGYVEDEGFIFPNEG